MSTSKPRLAARTAGLDDAVTRAFQSVLFSPDVMSFGAGFMNPAGFDVAGVRCAGASPQGICASDGCGARRDRARASSDQAGNGHEHLDDRPGGSGDPSRGGRLGAPPIGAPRGVCHADAGNGRQTRRSTKCSPRVRPHPAGTGSSCGRSWRTAGPPAHCWSARCSTACSSCPGRSSSWTSTMRSR